MDLKDKVAIVTGATRGIGRQVALQLARRGVIVVLAARTVEPRKRLPGTIGEVVAAIESEGGRALGVRTDMMSFDDLDNLMKTTIDTYGRLDILINNAAATTAKGQPLEDYSRDSWMDQFQINVHAPFWLMRLAVPHMKKAGRGVIVNMTSSVADMVPVTLGEGDARMRSELGVLLGYASSKAALSRLTNAAAPSLAADNITAVAVDPGSALTEMTEIMGEMGIVKLENFHSMDLPVNRILEICTSDEPLSYTGRTVRAKEPAVAALSGA